MTLQSQADAQPLSHTARHDEKLLGTMCVRQRLRLGKKQSACQKEVEPHAETETRICWKMPSWHHCRCPTVRGKRGANAGRFPVSTLKRPVFTTELASEGLNPSPTQDHVGTIPLLWSPGSVEWTAHCPVSGRGGGG